MIALLLPNIQVWPDSVFAGFSDFISTIANFNLLIPVMPTVFDAVHFMIRFLVYFFGFIAIVKVANYFRGASGL